MCSTRKASGATTPRRVAVSFGPQYGPITAKQAEECLREAHRRGVDDLVCAGFTIDGAAQAAIRDDPNPRVRCHQAHIRPDVSMGDLLRDTPGSQLFTVFGLPRGLTASEYFKALRGYKFEQVRDFYGLLE